MEKLNDLAVKYQTDKKLPDGKKAKNGVHGHGYTPHYEWYFSNRKIKNLLEIGISFGGSLLMWNKYLPDTQLWGMDISEKRFKRKKLEKRGIKIHIGDQSNPDDLKVYQDKQFDVIIDDGGHRMKQQQVSLVELFPSVAPGGLYVIEDIHTSLKASFWDNHPETPTLQVLKAIKRRDPTYRSNYIKPKQLKKLIEDIQEVVFLENEKICFIFKK